MAHRQFLASQMSAMDHTQLWNHQNHDYHMHLENGSSVLPADDITVTGMHSIAYLTAPRQNNHPSSSFSLEAPNNGAAISGMLHNPYLHPASSGNSSQFQSSQALHEYSLYNRLAIGDGGNIVSDMTDDGRAAFKRKIPLMPLVFDRENTNGYYCAGTSSNLHISSDHFQPKPMPGPQSWPLNPNRMIPSYWSSNLVEEGTQRNVRSCHTTGLHLQTYPDGSFSSSYHPCHFNPTVNFSGPDVAGHYLHSMENISGLNVPGHHLQSMENISGLNVPGHHLHSMENISCLNVPGHHLHSMENISGLNVPGHHLHSMKNISGLSVPGHHLHSMESISGLNVAGHIHSTAYLAGSNVAGQCSHYSESMVPHGRIVSSDSCRFNYEMNQYLTESSATNGAMDGAYNSNLTHSRYSNTMLPTLHCTSTRGMELGSSSYDERPAPYTTIPSHRPMEFAASYMEDAGPSRMEAAASSRQSGPLSTIGHSFERNGRARYNYGRSQRFSYSDDAYIRWLSEAAVMMDPLIFYNDQHMDMTLDIDDMSYEELLDLEDRIGNVSTGLSEGSISRCLVEMIYCSSHQTEEDEEERKCAICLEEYNDRGSLGKLRCGHDFHHSCIKKWLLIKNSCPMCKAPALSDISREKQAISS